MASAARPECAPFTDRNQYYFGSNGQILSAVQIETGKHTVPKASSEYFKRLIQMLKARGTEVVVIPVPRSGFTLAGTLDPGEVNGNIFSKANAGDFKAQTLNAYQATVDDLKNYGVTTVNFMEAANAELALNPGVRLFFLQDGHWRPEGAKVAANAVGKILKEQKPELTKLISTKTFKLLPLPSVSRDGFGWDVRVKLDCPKTDWKPLIETYPTVATEITSGGSLLEDDNFPVLLAGSSYSADSYKMGLAQYLELSLGASVTNIAINGGEAMSSILDYYTFHNPKDIEPKLIIWEIPTQYIDYISTNSFSPITLRQILPLLAENPVLLEEHSIPKLGGSSTIDFTSPSLRGSSYFIKISLGNYESRAMDIVLSDGKEMQKVRLAKERGRAAKEFTIELDNSIELKNITVSFPDTASGSAKIAVYKY
ncbi:hypothetical protein GCM10008949_30790 [Deinococcus humi]|nr:hypothetical protein GCM10008949_30790 [Deinococcus humi]